MTDFVSGGARPCHLLCSVNKLNQWLGKGTAYWHAVCEVSRIGKEFRLGRAVGGAMIRRSAQAGFTFIELMGVVAIMGILVVIIMPNIKNYTARAKVTEVVVALTNCRTSVSEIYQSGSSIPPEDWGCDTKHK